VKDSLLAVSVSSPGAGDRQESLHSSHRKRYPTDRWARPCAAARPACKPSCQQQRQPASRHASARRSAFARAEMAGFFLIDTSAWHGHSGLSREGPEAGARLV